MAPISQSTVRSELSFSGVGLHTGESVDIKVLPGEPGSGIVFIQDGNEQVQIPASWELVKGSSYLGVTLEKQDEDPARTWRVRTVEHLLAAFSGAGIDNAIVVVRGSEIPGMDGSSKCFTEAFQSRRTLVESKSSLRKVKVLKEVAVSQEDGNSRWAKLSPLEDADTDGDLNISVHLDFGTRMQPQSFSYWRSEFITRKVLEARTFGFMSDLEGLRANNLARGSSLDNTIAFNDNGSVINKEGLRFPKEPSMHKGLDALGDLRLGGVLSGRYESLRPGHSLNIMLLKKLYSSAKTSDLYDSN
eukprot:CAMPEP_0113967350 /NCGR_PEP_ID=MMETSP0011_2-20120614/8879_1 /TAXON_ID=101924 /ORGANISM="Rhodosorus marinus" /LENGTH=301 /DNA_ID=CAMNT_0000980219 /DNA_START=798 /DNA_END=1701 /DNA_ORIENTATION=+ /assembly_acc=CAM_ASM_000156